MIKKENLSSIIFFMLLAATLFFGFNYSFSTFVFQHLLPYDQKRVLELGLLISAPIICMVFYFLYERIILIFGSMRPKTLILLASFIYLGFLSALFSPIPMAGLLEWSLFVLLIFFAVFSCAISLEMGEPFFIYLVGLIYFIIATYSYSVISNYYLNAQAHLPTNFFPFFINPRFFGQFAIWTLPLLPLMDMWLQKNRASIFSRIPFFVLGSFWWALVLVSGSRGLLLAFAVASILGLIFYRKNALAYLWRQAVYIFIIIFAFSLLNLAHPSNIYERIVANMSHIQAINADSVNTRLLLYKSAFQDGLEHPLLGVGPMHFALKPTEAMQKAQVFNAHPHNSLLLIFAEWGIPAALVLMIFISILLRNFFRETKKDNFIHLCFSISLLSGLLYSLVSGVVVMPLSQIMGALIVGSVLSLYFQNKIMTVDEKKSPYWIVGGLIFLSGLVIVVHLSLTLPNLLRNETLWYLSHQKDEGQFVPRFWLQGWLSD